jgi:zinc/manganese transport system ATP-binding protein
MGTRAAAIRLQDLTVSYARHPAVHHLSGDFEPGSMTAIVGPNGAGKTTLLKAIVGLQPSEGRLEIAGAKRGDIAYLPQQAEVDRQFPISVRELALMGHWPRKGAFGRLGAAEHRAAENAIAAVGLEGFEGRAVGTLSSGQFQRAMFARVLVQDSPILLLDEPFNAIDAKTAEHLIGVVMRWHREARTVVCVLHDLDLVRERFPRTLLLARAPVAWGPTSEVLAPENLLRARAMSERWREDADLCEKVA